MHKYSFYTSILLLYLQLQIQLAMKHLNRLVPVLALTSLLLTSGKIYSQGHKNNGITQYVNPFIGTRDMGHCYPGATVPFGMVQLSPDTDTVLYSTGNGYNPEVYRYCAGYQYNDSTIVGFSHTHLHGTGHSDLGDFLIMPTTGAIKLNPGTSQSPEKGYRSRYKKQSEKASPGYYAVTLTDYKIVAELTATVRVGIHQYVYPKGEQQNLILDLVHGIYSYDGKVIWSSIRVENDTLITGYRQTNGWARNRFIYFALSLSKPITEYGLTNNDQEVYKGFWRRWEMDSNFPERSGRRIKAYFKFNSSASDTLVVKMALSPVSTNGAIANLVAETSGKNFEQLKAEARESWEKELSKIRIEADEQDKVIFYTALYHTYLSPTIYNDVSGDYRGIDGNIYKTNGFTNYTTFSLWDTFRAQHPLLTLIEPERTSNMISSMLAHYQQSVHGLLPVWSHHGNENWCMIGYHAVPVIADAYLKGIRGFDANLALKAMVSSATYPEYDGTRLYTNLGFVPEDKRPNSASTTLEYAYDDYTIHQMAKELGNTNISEEFGKRALAYKNLFDTNTGFMRAKLSNGQFKEPFDPLATHGQGYIEGNAWTYSLFVPHNIKGLTALLGGEKRLEQRLDSIFTMTLPAQYYAHTEDIEAVGIMGNYVHGNEPGHHIPYMYSYIGKPWKTQAIARKIMSTMYHNTPSGLCGNDDCGQMSAWYIFSALGFYPVTPASNQYVIGSPLVKSAQIQVGNNKAITVTAHNQSEKNIYIKKVLVDGKEWKNNWFPHSMLVNGCTIDFYMTSKPNKKWGKEHESRPLSMQE